MSRRSGIGVVAALALAVIGWALWHHGEAARPHLAPRAPRSEVDVSVPSTRTAPTPAPEERQPASVPAPAPAVREGEIDPCAELDPAPFARPSVNDLLRDRLAELNDRLHALDPATSSQPLREGLVAATDPSRGDEALALLARAPDRVQDGYDAYVAVAVALASNALGAGETDRAIRLAIAAERAAPTDPLPLVVDAIAHERRGEHALARERFAQAYALQPDEPSLAITLAWHLEASPDLSAAIAALDGYLAAEPGDRESARLRARLVRRRDELGATRTMSRRGVSVVAPTALDPALVQRALDVVSEGLTRSARLFGVAPREELTVFVYPDGDAMRRATCAQRWSGAIFNGALHTDAVTLAREPEARRSLVHEAAHAALHAALTRIPTWLDEGLAQYVAGDEGPSHWHSYEMMVREHTWVPFASMNDAFLVIDDSSDAGLVYHQALAMVLWLVEVRGERGIADAVAWLAGGGEPTRVLDEAARRPLDGETLLAFLATHIAARPR
jgi:Flp pilus assembly protein TadD